MTIRFRQSYSSTLLNGCPGQLYEDLRNGRNQTRRMTLGSAVDQLVFGKRAFHVITSTYKSGKRKGEPVSSWTPDALAEKEALPDDHVCVFARDVPKLEQAAQRVRLELLKRGVDLTSPDVICQQQVTWTGRDGTPMQGEPDIVVRDQQWTIDLKYGDECDPRKLRRMIWDMCWDVQGAAYQEAYGFHGGRHSIARASDSCFVMVHLSEKALRTGHDRLDAAREIWNRCLREDSWPWWDDCTVDPPEWAESKFYDDRGESNLAALGLTF